MEFLGFQLCKADPDIWIRKAVKYDGTKYWEYVLLYVDDALVVSEHGENILREEIDTYFEMKEKSIGTPSIYLGDKVRKVVINNGVEEWSFSSSQYVHAVINNVETHLIEKGIKPISKTESALSSNYRPELDVIEELNHIDAAYYQSLIGILRWMVGLGRVDMCVEVSIISSQLALPRQGHLEQLFYIITYLRKCCARN